MNNIISQSRVGVSFKIDDTHFIDCLFTNCTLEYSGGPVEFERTTMRGCRYVFFGRAKRTVKFLQAVELMPFDTSEWAEMSALVH